MALNSTFQPLRVPHGPRFHYHGFPYLSIASPYDRSDGKILVTCMMVAGVFSLFDSSHSLNRDWYCANEPPRPEAGLCNGGIE